ncbi:MAG: S41 family peptidase [Flavobacteriaceae bacterium]|jgi:hypothetical protein|nr:S41 family peptidase [Flavobacteriaceae bacterium]
MKRNFKQYIVLSLGFFMTVGAFNSCVKDDEISITEPTRYTRDDVKSYADLFKVFWNIMDQRYNYFYEQKRKDGMDWNTVYREYYPKFAALKTWEMKEDMRDNDILADRKKAIEYFTNIIDPIIDRHFGMIVSMPESKLSGLKGEVFSGGMKTKGNNVYNFNNKMNYMTSKIENPTSLRSGRFTYFMGNLKTNPDIYYISYNQFALYDNLQIHDHDRYLTPNAVDNYILTLAEIDKNSDLNAIKDINARNKARNFTVNILNQWNTFFNSADVKSFNNDAIVFRDTEVVSDNFIFLAKKLQSDAQGLAAYGNKSIYASVLNNDSDKYITWFMERMKDHVEKGYALTSFQEDAKSIVARGPFYQKFLNPLRKGDIKKLIIDVRDNGGGAVLDFRMFVERFVTKNTVWSYQRTKEGNGQFNYTPWVPMQTKPHKFGLPKNIPIVILTDKGSASMSEMSTMMLKSQGNHVISIGDYSAGATAGLTTDQDAFNGGLINTNFFDPSIAGVFRFYMPVMATKDINGNIVEGIGVKPDIFVTPPTDTEVAAMSSSPTTFVDRVINEAVKYLSGK